ncbi:hypothetical protein PVK64_11155 [Aliivibrio sp. S4TY2]|uniref:hypothetical protein n=1 Tax=unclassified Aliivibrio TaxID=2645654 RepID=UPI0023791CFC|nr:MULTISPECIES: hypothetical protein [unclassified Aliivibrio]MDD9156732.1 hypothetical protein [Aliivibrio sp. S4TY2]MDD9160218.1 hypothetical protein [Aliivibrio sp. S4TY1]MDD9164489.1 hypothetical protein [Aliivibrio sp. S4MY2]MDD9168641.1 hypothetical protein [Aliivibrio sp. S4MY4]MDD9184824.1 hypothetical protein [Aliivibrio sp. S4MY3]
MNDNNNIISMDTPENPLQELLKKGGQQFLVQAIDAELAILLESTRMRPLMVSNEWSEMAISLNEIVKLGLVISKLKYQK